MAPHLKLCALLGVVLLLGLASTGSASTCTAFPATSLTTSDNGQNLYSCSIADAFTGYLLQLGRSNKTGRYYFTAASNLYTSDKEPWAISSASDIRLLNTFSPVLWSSATSLPAWGGDLFLINQYYQDPDPDTDHIGYTSPHPWATNYFYSLLVTSGSVTPAAAPLLLSSDYALPPPSTLRSVSTVYDPQWNVSWWLSTNFTTTSGFAQWGAPYVLQTTISWVNHATNEIQQYADPSLGIRPLLTDIVYVDSRQLIFYGNGTRLYYTPRSNHPFGPSQFQPGLVNYLSIPGLAIFSMLHLEDSDTLLLGCSLGNVLELDLSTFTIIAANRWGADPTLGTSQLMNIVWMKRDSQHPNLLYLGAQGTSPILGIGRLYLNNRLRFSYFDIPTPTKYTYLSSLTANYYPGRNFVMNSNHSLLYVPGSGIPRQVGTNVKPFDYGSQTYYESAEPILYTFQTHSCGVHTSCSDCKSDPDFCGWCPVSKTCTDSASECPGEGWSTDYVCPVSTFATPSLVPAEGGVNATFYGTAFKAGLSCIFSQSGASDVSVNAAVVSETSISCLVPAAVAMTGATKMLSVQVRDALVPWGDAYALSYVACSSYSACGDCAISPACGWCLGQNQCTYSSLCQQTDVWTRQCPSVDSISPQSVSAFGGDVLSIATTSVLTTAASGYSYQVQFGNLSPVPATVVSGSKRAAITSTLQATMPLIASSGNQPIVVSLLRNPGSVVVANTSSALSAYNCSTFTACSTCFAAGSRCNWCSFSNACGDSSVVSGCGTSPSVCATLSSVTPPVAFDLDAAATLTFTGVNLLTLPAASLQCVFESTTTATQTTSATVSSATSATCSAVNTPVAVYAVSLGYGGVPATNSVPFEVYDCSAAPCSACLAPGKESKCIWCDDFSGSNVGCMSVGSSCAAPETLATCPSITSTAPEPISQGASTSVTLSGSFASLTVASSSCVFTPPSGTPVNTVATASTSSSSVSCGAVTLAPAGTWSVHVEYNSAAFTSSHNTTVFSCAVLTTCAACANDVLCGWSNLGCVARTVATINAISGCPVLTSATPNVALRGGGDLVTVVGGPYTVGTGLYTCNFGVATSTSAASTATTVVCPVPSTSISVATTININILGGSQSYSSSAALPFTYVDCPVFTSPTCSDACVSFPDANGATLDGCGFCSVSGLCTAQSRCADLWVPECFKSVNIAPKFALVDGLDIISVSVSKHPDVPVGQSVLPTDFTCLFGSHQVPASLVPHGNGSTIECQAPATGPSTTTLNLNYRNRRFTDPISFSFADCASATDCSSCLAKSPCGWCLDSQTCTTPTRCPLGNYTSTSCPDLRALIPATGSKSGGEIIQLMGNLFIPNDQLVVKFADRVIVPTFINNSTLQVKSPRHNKADSVTVELWYMGAKYAATSQVFTYKNGSNTVGIAVGLSLGLLFIVVLVIIVAAILYRRKAKGLMFNIREPDYQLVAFGANTELAYRLPSDSFQFLETVLGRYNFGMQVAMSAVAPPTEEDMIAKSVLYVAQSRGQSVGMINALVRGEISRCREENTIFRNNSVASKSFKFYSRVVGIPYLWKCMARVIYELEVLGNRSAKEQQKSDASQHSTSLLRMTMEVDMDRYAGSEGADANGGSAADVDAEVNSLQLKLTCQKLFSVLVKNGVSDIPAEFRKIFVEIDSQIMKKFNNDMAVYKAIGGFFFLRFVCPAITAPHYYGLLDNPPNETTQRQLVLISKVIQSLANMQMPGRKETYMESMSDFIEKNMGAVVKFYQDMREASRVDIGANANMEVPDDVKYNALAAIWEFCHTYQKKLETEISENADLADRDQLTQDFASLLQQYPHKPKKSGDAASSKAPRSKKEKKRSTNA